MSELELNGLLDSLVEEMRMPVALLVIEDPWLDALDDRVYGPLVLPAWSPETKALVTEYTARTGGAW